MFLHERWASSILITDSTYTIDSWNLVNTVDDASRLAFKPNFDLLMRLLALKPIVDITSCTKFGLISGMVNSATVKFDSMWLENEFADHAAEEGEQAAQPRHGSQSCRRYNNRASGMAVGSNYISC